MVIDFKRWTGCADCVMLFLPALSDAGSISPPAGSKDGQGNPIPTMKTLEQINAKLKRFVIN